MGGNTVVRLTSYRQRVEYLDRRMKKHLKRLREQQILLKGVGVDDGESQCRLIKKDQK